MLPTAPWHVYPSRHSLSFVQVRKQRVSPVVSALQIALLPHSTEATHDLVHMPEGAEVKQLRPSWQVPHDEPTEPSFNSVWGSGATTVVPVSVPPGLNVELQPTASRLTTERGAATRAKRDIDDTLLLPCIKTLPSQRASTIHVMAMRSSHANANEALESQLALWPRVATGAKIAVAAAVAIGATLSTVPPAFAAPATPASPATPVSESPPLQVDLPFEKVTLENGLEVILHEDHRTPVVSVCVWYHVGSKDEAPHRNGFAHLFEHMMFQGSKNVAEDTYFKYLEQAGASGVNGSTSSDRTNYYETVPANQLALALWLESDRMGSLLDHANEETFASQRNVVKNERRQNYENAPYGLVRQFINSAIYPENHPYHRLTIGSAEDLDAARLEDVKGFFRRYYVPNNATLVVAGDIDRASAKALIDKYFGTIARGADAKPVTSPEVVVLKQETRLDVEADVELARLQITWATPQGFAPGDADLDGVADVLTSGKSSRLYKRLVYDLQIAQDVSAHQGSGFLASTFDVSVTLKKGKSPAQALTIVDEEIAKLVKTPPTNDEVERARIGALTGLIFPLESVSARAERLNSYNQFAHDPGFLKRDIARYENLTPATVQKAAATYLPKGARIVTVVTPTKGAPRAGRLLGGGT